MARTPKTTTASADKDEADSGTHSGNSSSAVGEFEWSAPKESSSAATNPLFPSVSDPQISYSLPQWLAPERYKDKQSSQNTTQTRIFTIPLPQVPAKTKQAVRAYLTKHYPQQKSGMKDSERKLKDLKLEEKQASTKAKAAKDKLAQALFTKSEKIKEIRKAHEVETQKAMEELEAKMREDQRKENAELEYRIKEEVKLEYEKKFEEEMVHKRKRDQEEDEKEEIAAASAAKKLKEDDASGKEDASGNDDGIGENSTDGSMKILTKVEALEKKKEDLKKEMEQLSEKKREFYWLLKQVIQQEAMQKKKMIELKKAEAT